MLKPWKRPLKQPENGVILSKVSKKTRAEIIVFSNNFHGRTTTIVGFSTEEQYKQGFGPFTPGFKVVPYGEIEPLKDAINKNTVAVMPEPIQGEGGIIIPPDGYLPAHAGLRATSKTASSLLMKSRRVWDDVENYLRINTKTFKPDVVIIGKSSGRPVCIRFQPFWPKMR